MSQFRFQPSLPKFAVPQSYDLRLSPDLIAGNFAGTVAIDVDIVEKTRWIVLNAVDLSVNRASVSFTPRNSPEVSLLLLKQFDESQILVLEFCEFLQEGEGVLKLAFNGKLNEETMGFCRCTYENNGEKKHMALTQFEPENARRCFPCWDEPTFTATFKITLQVTPDLVVLSNMPVLEEKFNGNLKIVSYHESPIMSTYLVAIVVGLFDYLEDHTSDGIQVRVYCQVGKADQAKFALHVGLKTLDLFKEYFAAPYPLPKLDMIAVPDFAAESTKNYGLIAYLETSLLYDEQHSAASNRFMREEHEPLLNATKMSGNAGNNVDSNQFSAALGNQVQQPLFFGSKTTTSQAPDDDPMLGAAPDASQINQFLQILGLFFNPKYTKQIKRFNPELQSMTLKPEFFRLLNCTEAMQHMVTLQQALFSGYWNTSRQPREEDGATKGTRNDVEEMEIFADDVVMNKKTGGIGVVSKNKLSVFPIAKARVETLRRDEVIVVSRRFLHGQNICSVTDRRKLGVICGIDTKVDLAASMGDITHQDIGTKFLKRIRRFYTNDIVVYGSWLGVVQDLELSINVQFEDGAKITNSDPDPEVLEPIFRNGAEAYFNDPYYRGQSVVMYSNRLKRIRGHVTKHGVNTVTVKWIHTTVPGEVEPPELVRSSQVQRLHNYRVSEANWALGQRCVFEGDDYVIAGLRTQVTVKWNGGLVQQINGTELVKSRDKIFRGQFVSKKNLKSTEGYVRIINNGVAWVKWFLNQQKQQPELLHSFELQRHRDYKFKVSDLVVRSRSVKCYEPSGFVIGIEEGRLEIEWEDDSSSVVGPEDIIKLFNPQDDDSDDDGPDTDDGSDDEGPGTDDSSDDIGSGTDDGSDDNGPDTDDGSQPPAADALDDDGPPADVSYHGRFIEPVSSDDDFSSTSTDDDISD